MTRPTARLGLRANARQFTLLVALNAFVGAMVGLERSVLPLVGEEEFGLASSAAILSFVVAFGVAKAFTNLAAGGLAERAGRKRLLVAGWLFALPVPILVALAPSWEWIVVANLFLGVNQGLAWSMTVVMKIDLVGSVRRGLALGLNESAGYLGVSLAALASGALAAAYAPRTVVWVGAAIVAGIGTLVSVFLVSDTAGHVAVEQRSHGEARPGRFREAFARGTVRDPVLRACSQAGLVNNLNDALVWGLVPLSMSAAGAEVAEIGLVAGAYPAVWGVGQLATGWASDHLGRKPLIAAGMLVQALALALLAAGDGAFGPSFAAAVLLGAGTALVYPTLIAAVSDVAAPVDRAALVGVYRFWRDAGFVVGALLAGLLADAAGTGPATATVAALTAASGLWVAVTSWPGRRLTVGELLARSRRRIAPRLTPEAASEEAGRGALLVDVRADDERQRNGVIPGSIHIPLSVLEWRADPDCEFANPHIGGLGRRLVVFCAQGFSSSLAAGRLRDLGYARATDIVGGFAAWKETGLPVVEAPKGDDGGLPGMAPPQW